MSSRYEYHNKSKRQYRYDDRRKKDKYDNSKSPCRTNFAKIDREGHFSQELSNKCDGNHEDFCFSKYKYELNKIFSGNLNVVQDVEDFWKFVSKYEALQKKLNTPYTSPNSSLNAIGVPKVYHKLHCINFKLSFCFNELFARVPPNEALTKERLLKFQNVIILYLDFKQKEKFAKLKKLRESQANLPVSQYKDKIIETIKKERVVIIAGDTGCGKSTQVPQYLYAAGFQKIGTSNNCSYLYASKFFNRTLYI